MFREELYEIHTELDDIKARLDSLCKVTNTNISSLQSIVDAMQKNDYVEDITPITEGGQVIGYEITFTQSGSVKIYHGEDGATGAAGKDGSTPVIGVKQDTDGRWYWTIDGEFMLDSKGEKVLAAGQDGAPGADGEDGEDGKPGQDGAAGADGKDGVTPQLKIEMTTGMSHMTMARPGSVSERQPETTEHQVLTETLYSVR